MDEYKNVSQQMEKERSYLVGATSFIDENAYAKDIYDLAKEYEEFSEREDMLIESTVDLETAGYPEAMTEALQEMKPGEVRFLDLSENSSGYLLLYKKDIQETAETWLENDGNRTSILIQLRGEEFQAMVDERREALQGLEYNEEAMYAYRASAYYTFTPPASSSESSSSQGNSSSASSSSSSSSGSASSASQDSSET